MILVDSNIWIYYLDASLPEHNYAVSFLEKLIEEKNIAITTIIIIEVCHYLYKRLGADFGHQKSELFILGGFHIIDFHHTDLMNFRENFKLNLHLGLGGRDITVLTSMIKAGIDTIATHDQDFKYLNQIKVLDPIKSYI